MSRDAAQSRTDREHLDHAIAVERARLIEVFKQAPSFLAVLRGPNHVFEFANEAYFELAGRREIIGKALVDAIPEVRGQGFEELLDRVLETGEPFIGRETPAMVVRGDDKRLEQVFVNFIYQPFIEMDGTRSGVVVHGFEVTDHVQARLQLQRHLEESEHANSLLQQQQLELELANQQLRDQTAELELQAEELQDASVQLADRTEDAERSAAAVTESERQWRTMLDAIPILAWTAQPDGYIDWYNRRWYDYTATTPAEMAGWGWQSVHDPATLPRVLERWQASIATGGPFEMTFPLRAGDGSFRPFLTRVSPVLDAEGKVVRWFGTNTDVQSEHAAREAAERANQAKTDFLAMMSHELRTPLNAIAGYAQLLEIGVHGPLAAEQHDAITRIQRSQRHLLSLINDVLNFAKLEAGHVEYSLQPVSVRQVIDDIEAFVAPQIQAKGLRFISDVCNDERRVVADAEKLEQILVNLLSNAIKFTPAGGTVLVSCRHEESHVDISVKDTGIGISSEHLSRIFEPFIQIERRLNTSHEGTGLGLSISRDLAQGMGGTLYAQSELGVGSEFTVRLRVAEPSLADESTRARRIEDLSKRHS